MFYYKYNTFTNQFKGVGNMSNRASLHNRPLKDVKKLEKLEIVGELAAGIVHEIRNPLTSIFGFVQLLEQGVHNKDYFNLIYSSFNDIEEYLKALLIIARPQPNEQKLVNMTLLVEDILEQVKHKINSNRVHINTDFELELPNILCDETQMSIVFKNLITNSIEATLNEGIVSIFVRKEDTNLLIKITDTGIGMSKERLAKLGEPFFNLKEKGTGIGLMVCYRIIWQYNGSIFVESEENKGTTIEVRIPFLDYM